MQTITYRWTAYILCILSYLFAGLASTMMSAYLPEVIATLKPSATSAEAIAQSGAYLNAISLFGWMAGGFLFGFFSDHTGRKWSLVIATLICGLSTLLIYFANDWLWVLCLRFITGMGIGGILLITTVLIAEIWPASSRPVSQGILAVSFPAGIVATGAVTVLFSSWRNAFLLGLVEVGVALAMAILLRETDEWGKSKKQSVQKSTPMALEFRRALLHGAVIFGSVLIGLWAIFSWMPTWVQSILPAGQDGQTQRGIIMMILGMGGIAGGVISGFLIQRFGTRAVLVFVFSGLIAICLVLFLGNKSFSPVVYAETLLLSMLFGISQGALSGYIPGLFPTVIRAFASGICFNIGRFFTATAVFFIGSLVGFFGGFGNALVSFSLMFLVALLTTIINSKQIKKNENGIHSIE